MCACLTHIVCFSFVFTISTRHLTKHKLFSRISVSTVMVIQETRGIGRGEHLLRSTYLESSKGSLLTLINLSLKKFFYI